MREARAFTGTPSTPSSRSFRRDSIAGVADQLAGAADDAVAGHHDRQGIVTQRLRHRAHRRRPAELARDPGVGRDRTVRHRDRRLHHLTLEVAARGAEIERPVEVRAATLDELAQLTVQLIELGATLLGLDPGLAEQARAGGAAATQILDQRHAVLGDGDEDRPERRRRHAIAHQPRAQIGQSLDQSPARVLGVGGRQRGAQIADHRLDRAVVRVVVPAGRALGDVRLHPAGRRGHGFAGRRGDQVRLDRDTGRRFAGHRVDSVRGSTWPSRLVRILRSAWNT